MNYDDIIRARQQQAAEARAADEIDAQRREERKAGEVARARRRFMELVVPELEKARLALVGNGHHAETSSGDTRHGPRRCLRLDPTRPGAIYGVVFQLLAEEPIVRPELRTYRLQDGWTPAEPMDHSKAVGIGPDFTAGQVREAIAEFIGLAI